MINKIAVYDIDGVLVDSSHRYQTRINSKGKQVIDLNHWIANDTPQHAAKDTVLPSHASYRVDLAHPSTMVVVATARACVANDHNYALLHRIGVPDYFIHREGRNDCRGGAQLKVSGLKPIIAMHTTATVHIWEDNFSYLSHMTRELAAVPHFIQSKQGH